VSAGASKAPVSSYDDLKSPHIALHRYGAGNFNAHCQLSALHGANGHHANGIFTVAQRVPAAGRPWQERSHLVRYVEAVAGMLEPEAPDLYVSQQSFWSWRRIASLKHLGCLYADLDYRKRVKWADSRPEDVFWSVMRALDDANIPPPSYGLSTGNGLCLVWLHSFVPRAALPRWAAMQNALAEALDGFGADKNALDAARVFRIVGSRNPRARDWQNEIVRPLYQRDAPDRLRQGAFAFDDLADQILPLARAKLVALRVERAKRRADRDDAAPRKPTTYLTTATYYESVLTDLQRLRHHRYGEDGAIPSGSRDEWLFIASCAMSHLAPPAVLAREIAALAAEAGGWNEREAHSRMSAVLRRAHASARGETIIDMRGEEVDPRYRFKSTTVVDRLQISPAEMQDADLRVLVDQDRRRELNTQRTRESRHRRGATPREQAQAERLSLGRRAIYRAAGGDSISDIALAEGVSRFQVSKAMREAKEDIVKTSR
jgi:hypothetical protein